MIIATTLNGGSRLRGMTKMLAEGRQQASTRLVEEAEAKGASAILAFRFDTSDLGGAWTEICAYGTAPRPQAVAPGRPDRSAGDALAPSLDAQAARTPTLGGGPRASGAEPPGCGFAEPARTVTRSCRSRDQRVHRLQGRLRARQSAPTARPATRGHP